MQGKPFLAAGQAAEGRPPVRRLCDPHEAAALDTAEAAQGLGIFGRPHVVVRAVPVGVPPAVRAAVFLRRPVG